MTISTPSSPAFSTPAAQGSIPLLQLFRDGRYNELIQRAAELRVTPQSQPLDANLVAASYFKVGKYDSALQLLEQLEVPLQHDPDFLSLYGATCRRLGLLDRARKILASARATKPDSLAIKNNYANVLIDLGELAEARQLLEQLLLQDPDYSDARVNLNRIKFREQPRPATADPSQGQPLAWQPVDPLMRAFAPDEVAAATPKSMRSDAMTEQLVQAIPDGPAQALASEQMQLAAKAVKEGRHGFALDLCSQALAGFGQVNGALYIHAADAYLGLQRLREAEICLLHALQCAEPSLPVCINLCSLACLRADLALARHYLDLAAGLDPDNPLVAQARDQLERQQRATRQPYHFQERWSEPSLKQVTTADKS